MTLVLDHMQAPSPKGLSERLEEVVSEGWKLGPAGSVLLHRVRTGSDVEPSGVAMHEYDNNKIMIPFAGLACEPRDAIVLAATQAISLAGVLLESVRASFETIDFEAMVSVWVDEEDDDFWLQGSTVRIYSRRGTLPEWLQSLEKFSREAILIVD